MACNDELALLRDLARLAEEFSGLLPAATVAECFAECRNELVAGGASAGLAPAVRALTRARLCRLAYGPSGRAPSWAEAETARPSWTTPPSSPAPLAPTG